MTQKNVGTNTNMQKINRHFPTHIFEKNKDAHDICCYNRKSSTGTIEMTHKNIGYPDFGFEDRLNFDIRNEIQEQNPEYQYKVFSIWHMLNNYVQDKSKFQRLNNLIDDFSGEKERVICQKILNINKKV